MSGFTYEFVESENPRQHEIVARAKEDALACQKAMDGTVVGALFDYGISDNPGIVLRVALAADAVEQILRQARGKHAGQQALWLPMLNGTNVRIVYDQRRVVIGADGVLIDENEDQFILIDACTPGETILAVWGDMDEADYTYRLKIEDLMPNRQEAGYDMS